MSTVDDGAARRADTAAEACVNGSMKRARTGRSRHRYRTVPAEVESNRRHSRRVDTRDSSPGNARRPAQERGASKPSTRDVQLLWRTKSTSRAAPISSVVVDPEVEARRTR